MAAGTALASAVSAVLLRGRLLRWGATTREALGPLPGDSVLPEADLVATRAITVRAGAAEVWPWLAQMGQGRGGLYSYDWLENLVGCRMRSADELVGRWQDVAAGDDFLLHPDVPLRVVEVRPPRSLVVRGGATAHGHPTDGGPGAPYDFTWAFVLAPQGAERTRLLVRERYRYRAPWARLLVEPVSVISFVMTERMLRGIRDRAEGRPSRAAGGRPHVR